jgi:hypothetical protein
MRQTGHANRKWEMILSSRTIEIFSSAVGQVVQASGLLAPSGIGFALTPTNSKRIKAKVRQSFHTTRARLFPLPLVLNPYANEIFPAVKSSKQPLAAKSSERMPITLQQVL